MKRSLLKKFDFGQIIPDIVAREVPFEEAPTDSVVIDAKAPFFKLVYALDSRTKLPKGDLQYMVSDKSNPEVKKWVLDNLMLDTSQASNPVRPTALSDDDIAILTRQPSESVESYAERVNRFARENSELAKRLYEQSVSRRVEASPLASE